MNKKYELAVNLQQDFTAEEQARGRANIGAVSAADVELAILSYASLAAITLRFSFSKLDYDPTVAGAGSTGTWKKVSAKFNNVWDWTGSGTSFNSAFEGAFASSDNLVSVIAAGDTSAVTDMGSMFKDCSSLMSIPLFDTSAVTNMYYMFYRCSSLTSVPLFDTSSVASMRGMFEACLSLTSVPLFNTSSVTSMRGMFKDCSSLTSVPLFATSAVTNMYYMFYGCSSLTSIPLFDTSAVTDMSNTFNGCTKVEGGALALYQRASTQATPPINTSNCFSNCGKDTATGAAELAQIPASWGGTAP